MFSALSRTDKDAGETESMMATIGAALQLQAKIAVGKLQVASLLNDKSRQVEAGWADRRDAQSLTAGNDKHVGLALAIDIGGANDIDPRNLDNKERLPASPFRTDVTD